MLQFHCSACGKQVQGDESLAGKSVLCPVCNTAMTAPLPSGVTATPPAAASITSFHEGSPPTDAPMRSISKIAPGVLTRWTPYLCLAALLLTFALLLIPSVQKARVASIRTESTNNLKQIGLAFHLFHAANKRLPYNGTAEPYQINGVNLGGPAIAGDKTTGSWAFMILPFIDQGPMFDIKATGAGVSTYMCPGRGRLPVGSDAGVQGAWTDYFLNPFLNDPNGNFDAQDNKLMFDAITDAAGRTVLVGHGQIRPADYASTTAIPGFTANIFNGGSRGLCRPNRRVLHSRDSDDSMAGDWGGPFPTISLMCMADATVRGFPYSLTGGAITNGTSTPKDSFGSYLTPHGNDNELWAD